MRRLTILSVGLLAMVGAVVLPAEPASAAVGQCVSYVITPSPIPPPAGPPTGALHWYPVSSSGSSYCWMQRGNRSPGVLALQMTLTYCYGQGLAFDGDFGPRTQAALRVAQSTAGARADGVYGPETRSRLKFYTLGAPCLPLIGIG